MIDSSPRKNNLGVTVNLILALIIAVATLFSTPTTEAPVENVSQVQVEEDEAGWDCETMGNESCTSTEDVVLANDASVTWTDYMDIPQTGTDIAYTWVLTMDQEPVSLPSHQFALHSIDLGVWHIYQADVLRHA